MGALEGIRVLDLFAGSGALGLEAISRGAARCVFVERDATTSRLIRSNAVELGFAESCHVQQLEVGAALRKLQREGQVFELVLADPPYADEPDPVLQAVAENGVLASGGLMMLEHSRRAAPADACRDLVLIVRRRHGDTEVSLYRREAEEKSAATAERGTES